MYKYKAKIVNIVDGDTFDLDVDLGFYTSKRIRARLLGIDTPETKSTEKELGLIVKQYAIDNFLNREVLIKSEKEETTVETDSFGRWLVSVIFLDTFDDVLAIYNKLGVNKLYHSYSEENVLKLRLEE